MIDELTQKAAEHIHGLISEAFKEDNAVLWLVSGGSALGVAIKARELLGTIPDEAVLHVGLIDERYGVIGHADSNFTQLLDAGFDTDGLTMHSILENGVSKEVCARNYAETLQNLFTITGLRLGLLGIGADGHTAGILPHSPLVSTNTSLVGSYTGPDFERISVTPLALRQLDEAILFGVGETKWPALRKLAEDGPEADIPARIIKTIKAYTIYTDYKEGVT